MTLAHRRSQKNWTLVTFCTFMEVANSMEVANYLSVCLNTVSTLYAIPYGLSGAVSTRVSNELGAGNPQGARLFVFTMMLMAVLEAVIVGVARGCGWQHIGAYMSILLPSISVEFPLLHHWLSGLTSEGKACLAAKAGRRVLE
ncbi:hypothetical protein DM860_008367 [Cuscuta australis]|uniref:Uncharacterized protein n=1 Tax=Cuscuta australis TaxID=267555 RepID=A0A328D342_9ASTE|nr:hypothetical protein DM860_008367 [Cuscuta australis]